jgi:DNA-binding XRE family transcriptional regulator
VAEPVYGAAGSPIEIVPVVVLSQVFTARPSSIPDIRDFVRRCLAESPLTDEGNREVSETVFRALLDAAGPSGSIQVAFRIFPEHVEVDVLRSDTTIQSPTMPGPPVSRTQPVQVGQPPPNAHPDAYSGAHPDAHSGQLSQAAQLTQAVRQDPSATPESGHPNAGDQPREPGEPGHSGTFADWMSSALRREGLTQEAAARQLGVSVKTVSRWVGGATEPRLRDLRRIQEVFGEVPLP